MKSEMGSGIAVVFHELWYVRTNSPLASASSDLPLAQGSSRGWGLVAEGHLLCVWKVTTSQPTLEEHAMMLPFLGMRSPPYGRPAKE